MKRQRKQAVRLKDIAEKTGYSINTVSRALRGKDDIAEETIRRIRTVADSFGYTSNAAAASLRRGYTNTLAVILGDISNPHFAIMMREIEEHARQKGYLAFLLNTNEEKEVERKAIQRALNQNVDGIIICPTQSDDENINFLIKSGIPFIQIGRRTVHADAGYVICNDEEGGYLAAKHLLDSGHRDVLFLNAPSYISSAAERRSGFLRAFEERGLSAERALIREVSLVRDNVGEVLEQLLERKEKFSAIFAFSDSIAWRAWRWLDECGYRVPQDFSLVGFDHIQSKLSIPFPLTTISSHKTQMSIMAVDYILKMIEKGGNEDTAGYRTAIGTKLVRGTTVRQFAL